MLRTRGGDWTATRRAPHTGDMMKTYGLVLPLLMVSAVACGPAASEGTTDGSTSTGDTTNGDESVSVSVTSPTTTTAMTATGMTATDPTTETTSPTTDTETTETTVDPDTSATGTTEPETTTEPESTTGTESTTDETTTTGGDPAFYGPCDFTDPENPVCPGEEVCLVVDFGDFAGQHWCGIPCEDDASGCPESPNGDALVECSGLGLCSLDCEDTECPEGMECNQIGSGDRCAWPAPR